MIFSLQREKIIKSEDRIDWRSLYDSKCKDDDEMKKTA
jgi:hypothetical protein